MTGTAVPVGRVAADPRTDWTPLTTAQEGLWFAQRLDPDNPIFWTSQAIQLAGPLDREAFCRAVDTTMAEADGLTIGFRETPAGPEQQIGAHPVPPLTVIDLRHTPDPASAANQWMTADRTRPRDLQRDPLVNQTLFILGDAQHCWYLGLHHLVTDGYATMLLLQQVAAWYRAMVQGDPPPTPLPPHATVLQADADYHASEHYQRDREWWQDDLAHLTEVRSLTSGIARSAVTAHRTARPLPTATIDAIKAAAQTADQLWPDVLIAVTAAWVARLTGSNEVVLGLPTMNRFGRSVARVPSLVMNVLPCRLIIDERTALQEVLRRTAGRLRQVRRHGRYRGEQVRRDLGRSGQDQRLHGPLVNVLPFDEPLALPGIDVTSTLHGTGPVDDLSIEFRSSMDGQGLALSIEANPALYEPDTVATFADSLLAFLDVACRAETLSAVPTVSDAAARAWLGRVNATAHPVPATTLTALIEATMQRQPDAVAIRDETETLTWRDLEHRTRALALQLQSLGAHRETIVSIELPRSIALVVGIVAILRSGAAWLPIDPSDPAPRRQAMLETAQPVLRLVATPDDLPGATLHVEEFARHTAAPLPAVALRPDDPAYVIYTSGSTGTPKGVMIEHGAIVNRLLWMQDALGVTTADVFLQKTPATFDVSVWEFILPLISGATLVVAPPDLHRDPIALARLIREAGVTIVHFVPPMLALFVEATDETPLPLRRIVTSGEALPATLRDRVHARWQLALDNLYGPTEAAIDVTWWQATADDTTPVVPLGYPVWNTRLYVLDAQQRLLPPTVEGELYLAGAQLARGYLGRDDLTSERFRPDPFGPPGARMYATGDRASWRHDGAVLYHGRSDDQVKIRGVRIELEDVAAAVRRLPGVAEAVVIRRDDHPGDPALVAYVVAGGVQLHEETMLAALRDALPTALVPSACVVLDALPLTSSGKVDRRALPAPTRTTGPSTRAPDTERERHLVALFREVLDLSTTDAVSVDSDFFRLGGHSLRAARLLVRIREALQLDPGLGAIFAHSTPARLAAHLDSLTGGTDDLVGLDPLLLLAGDPASPLAPLFLVHPAGGITWCYGALARALTGNRPVYGIQSPGLHPDDHLPDTLDALASLYVDRITAVGGTGPIHLAGWSVGGIIAQSMAVECRTRNLPVGLVALLDAYPADRWRSATDPTEATALKALLLIAGIGDETTTPLTRADVQRRLRERQHPLGHFSDTALDGVLRVVTHNNRLVRRHEHRHFDGPVRHVRAALDHQGTDIHPDAWLPYVGTLLQHDLPVTHPGIPGQAVAARLAHLLEEDLSR